MGIRMKKFLNLKLFPELMNNIINDISLYHYIRSEYEITGRNRILIYILALSTAVIISMSVISFLSISRQTMNGIVFILVVFLQILSAGFFLIKVKRLSSSEDLFIVSEIILIATVLLYNNQQSIDIYKSAMLLIVIIMLGSALFSKIFWFLLHSFILILFSIITYYYQKGESPLNELYYANDIYNYSLFMVIYFFIMLMILRTLSGELLKKLQMLLNFQTELYDCTAKNEETSIMHEKQFNIVKH